MLPSVGTPPLKEAAEFVIDLLNQKQNKKKKVLVTAAETGVET